jgi:hypothetical protein
MHCASLSPTSEGVRTKFLHTFLSCRDLSLSSMVKALFRPPFADLTQEQAAKQLGVSINTAERVWAYERAQIFRAMRKGLRPLAL